jgi:hypothetical protein
VKNVACKRRKRIKRVGYNTRKWRNLWAPGGNRAIVRGRGKQKKGEARWRS